MDSEEVLGWIEALENYFDLEDIEADKKVKVEKARLRGTTLTWWTSVQNERERKGGAGHLTYVAGGNKYLCCRTPRHSMKARIQVD